KESGFFLRTLENWRRSVLLTRTTMSVMVHLGGHVLDGATVRTAVYTLLTPRVKSESIFVRLLGKADRESRLNKAVNSLRSSTLVDGIFVTPQEEFEKLPFRVFGYWCSPELRNAFIRLPALEQAGAHVRVGLQTSDKFRFLRLRWEIAVHSISNGQWYPYAKGGEYSPYHDDIHLVVEWPLGKSSLAAFPDAVIRNSDDYL